MFLDEVNGYKLKFGITGPEFHPQPRKSVGSHALHRRDRFQPGSKIVRVAFPQPLAQWLSIEGRLRGARNVQQNKRQEQPCQKTHRHSTV